MYEFSSKVQSAPIGNTYIFSTGQAGFIIKSKSGQLLGIDMYLTDCVERIEGHVGYHRLLPKILAPSELEFDAIIATHPHKDHFDDDAIPALMANRKTKLFASVECKQDVKRLSMSNENVTYVYIDESGVKISKYRENCKNLNGIYYHDVELMKAVARKIRAFHDVGYDLPNWEEYDYDPVYQCERLFSEASKMKGDLFKIFEKEWDMIRRLQKYADMDGVKHTMCHNDINSDNVLLTDTTLDIIDWEFAGYNDPGYDFGRVIAGLDYGVDEPMIMDILEAYFGRPATELEHLHFMAYAAIHNWYYVGWALYKESINESSRDWMLFFFKQTKKLAEWCLPKYEKLYGAI